MNADRPLPHSLDAERTLLGCVLYGAALELVGFLEAADFFDPKHRTIFGRMLAMRAGIDLVTLRSALADAGELEKAGGVAYVAGLVDGVPDLAGSTRYAGIVKEKSAARKLIRDCERISVEVLRTGGLPADLIADAKKALDEGSAPVSSAKPAGRLMRDFETRFESRFGEGNLTGISTGHALLDATTGGFQRSVLQILAGRTSSGKTAMGLGSLFHAVSAGSVERAAYYSLEMSDGMLSDRLVANVSGVGLWLVRNPRMASAAQRDRIADAVAEIAALGSRLVVNDRLLEFRAIDAEVRREARAGLDLVVLDYIQLVRGGKGERRYVELGDVSARLVQLGKDTGAAVVALAQLGRDAATRKPCLVDLRESGNLEQDARVVLLLDRPRKRGESAPECQAWLYVAKNSEGDADGEIELHFDGDRQRFEEVADADLSTCRHCTGARR